MTLGVLLPPAPCAAAAPAVAAATWAARRLDDSAADYLVVTAAATAGLPPVLVGAYLGRATRRIGVVVEAPASGAEPLHLSTALATLDITTHGRAGWLVPLADPSGAPDASAVVDAVARLWDSWEDDAVIRDGVTGRYLDRTRLHRVDVTGPGFTIAGPSITPRPPQGRLPILAAPEAAGLARLAPSADWIELVVDGRGVRQPPGGDAPEARDPG
ncbi:MAG: nitrilotriacetate monooxygenase, partial [Microbacterium sp.]